MLLRKWYFTKLFLFLERKRRSFQQLKRKKKKAIINAKIKISLLSGKKYYPFIFDDYFLWKSSAILSLFSFTFYVYVKKKKKKILRCFLRNTWLLFIKISLKKNPPPCVCVRGYFPTFFFVFLSPLLLCFVLKSLPLFLLAKIFLHEHQQNKIAAARGVFTKEKQRRKCTIEKKVWISPVFFSLFLNLFFFSLFKEFFQVIFFRKFFFRS